MQRIKDERKNVFFISTERKNMSLFIMHCGALLDQDWWQPHPKVIFHNFFGVKTKFVSCKKMSVSEVKIKWMKVLTSVMFSRFLNYIFSFMARCRLQSSHRRKAGGMSSTMGTQKLYVCLWVFWNALNLSVGCGNTEFWDVVSRQRAYKGIIQKWQLFHLIKWCSGLSCTSMLWWAESLLWEPTTFSTCTFSPDTAV